MRSIGIAAAGLVLLAASPAFADTVGVVGIPGNTIVVNGTQLSNPPLEGQYTAPGGTTGASWDSFVTVTPTYVSFESSNAVSGTSATATSFSSVNLTFTNTTNHAITPTVSSDIVPASFGMYLANVSSGCGGNIYTGCGLNTSTTFQQALSGGSFGRGDIATAEFDFKIFDGQTEIYNVNGFMNLRATGNATALNIMSDFDPNVPPLANLNLEYGNPNGNNQSNQSAYIYSWDATPVLLQLASLGAGQTRTLTYQTTVRSFSSVGCSLQKSTQCLISKAGFGDPIGRGGADLLVAGADTVNTLSFSLLSAPGGDVVSLEDGGGFDSLNFTPAFFGRPNFDPNTGLLTFNIIDGPPTVAVPEPATWISLILGFGLLGTVLRRRRALALA
jgi:hypothetical protein